MSTWIKVARYQLIDRNVIVIPWGILSLVFLINVVMAAEIPARHGRALYVGALSAIYVIFIAAGALSISRQLPSRWPWASPGAPSTSEPRCSGSPSPPSTGWA